MPEFLFLKRDFGTCFRTPFYRTLSGNCFLFMNEEVL